MSTNANISGLYVYPVKSLRGISLKRATALHSGIEHDRQWAIFTPENSPLTQRKNPLMALVTPAITDTGLVLSAPGMGDIAVEAPSPSSDAITVKVWKDNCIGQSASNYVNEWLSDALKSSTPLRLLKTHAAHQRAFIKPERFGIKGQYFSDAAPYLITNSASLDALNTKLSEQGLDTVDSRHFRANIVLSGLPAFSEHQYQHLSAPSHNVAFDLVDHCQRCVMITVNPDKGEYLPKATPFKTLAQLNPMPDNTKAPAYGVNSTLSTTQACQLEIGQEVVLKSHSQ